MNTNLQNKTFKDPVSLEFRDYTHKADSIRDTSTSALINHKERCKEKTNNLKKQSKIDYPLQNSNNKRPRNEVTVEFAAKQLFQILLINVKYNHSKSVSELDLLDVPNESNPLIINV